MARAQSEGKSLPGRLLDLINPLRDPSFTVAIVLTFILVTSQNVAPPLILVIFLLTWLAVKSAVWFVVNTIFSMGFIARKSWWVVRHPRLAWRLLDALGTEEIIVGGLHPDMFVTEDGELQEAQIGAMAGVMQRPFGGPMYQEPYADNGAPAYNAGNAAELERYRIELERLQHQVGTYEQLMYDWISFTEEKWRAVSDSQLGWKPLRGRWNSWDEIYGDSYAARTSDRLASAAAAAGEAIRQRFDNARSRGSAASSVACFLRDLDTLRQSITLMNSGSGQYPGMTGNYTGNSSYAPQSSASSASRTGKSPIIRDPRIVDAG